MSRSYTLAGLTLAALIGVAIVAVGTLSSGATDAADTAAPSGASSPLPPGHPALDQNGPAGGGDGASAPAGEAPATIAALEKKLAKDPASTKTALELGAAYLSADQPAKALKLYNDVLRREPGDLTARVQLALALHGTGHDARAVAILQHVVRDAPDDQTAHYNLAIIYYSQGKKAPAKREWQTAAAIDPTSRLGLSSQNFVDLMEGRTPAPTTAP